MNNNISLLASFINNHLSISLSIHLTSVPSSRQIATFAYVHLLKISRSGCGQPQIWRDRAFQFTCPTSLVFGRFMRTFVGTSRNLFPIKARRWSRSFRTSWQVALRWPNAAADLWVARFTRRKNRRKREVVREGVWELCSGLGIAPVLRERRARRPRRFRAVVNHSALNRGTGVRIRVRAWYTPGVSKLLLFFSAKASR